MLDDPPGDHQVKVSLRIGKSVPLDVEMVDQARKFALRKLNALRVDPPRFAGNLGTCFFR